MIIVSNGIVDITDEDIRNKMIEACDYWGLSHNFNELSSIQFNTILDNVGLLISSSKVLYDKYNKYDKTSFLKLLDYYISLCNIYNKRIYHIGYYSFIGIKYNYDITNMSHNNVISGNRGEGLNGLHGYIVKKCKEADAERAMGNATDSKQAVLNIAYNNFVHGWSGQIVANEVQATAKTLSEVKQSRLETSARDEQKPRFSISAKCTKDENP